MGDHAEESFSNVRTVRSFAMETKHVETFRCAVTRLYGNGKKEALVHSTIQFLIMVRSHEEGFLSLALVGSYEEGFQSLTLVRFTKRVSSLSL